MKHFGSTVAVVLSLLLMTACSNKNTMVMWVSGVKTECIGTVDQELCLNVYEGDDVDSAEWKPFYDNIEGFEFEEGYMKKIKVKKKVLDGDKVPADGSSIEYKMTSELEKVLDPRTLLNGSWEVSTFFGDGLNPSSPITTIAFDLNEMRVSGFGGCNKYSGPIKALTDDRLQLGNVMSTRMACEGPHLESIFFKTMGKVRTYSLKGDVMTWYDEAGREMLTLTKESGTDVNDNASDAPSPLLNGNWGLFRLPAASLRDVRPLPTLIIDLDGKSIGGSDGCNEYSAPIDVITGRDINFGVITATEMACENMDVPNGIHGAIRNAASYSLTDGVLVWFDESGKKLASFRKVR